MSHPLWYTNHMMKMNEEQLNETPHYTVYDDGNDQSHYFPKSDEGLKAAIKLADKLETWVGDYEGLFINRRSYNGVWEHESITKLREQELVDYYKSNRYHGD